MKKLRLYRFVSLMLLSMLVFHTTIAQAVTIDNIERAFQQSNAADLSGYLDNAVDITINNKQSTYSATQAQLVLREYFRKNTVKDFSFKRISTPVNNSMYAIGTMSTKSGAYKVFIFLKQLDTKPVLQQLKIEKQSGK